ncbi:MAG: ABC transporter substrate-binding protein [Thermodesulfobacteriota bacterium]
MKTAQLHLLSRSTLSALLSLILLICAELISDEAAAAPQDWLQARTDAIVIVSREIRPYLAAREGAMEILGDAELSVTSLTLADVAEAAWPALLRDVSARKSTFILAIGPEAARFLNADSGIALPPAIFTMMLNPEKVLGENGCGVFLNIPPATQLQEISRLLPQAKRIAILHDPGVNTEFVRQAADLAAPLDRRIVSLPVSSKKNLPAILEKNWANIDAIWFIPDRTVISESIVSYIIKEAFLHRIPTIGYNRFFADSGALLSFVFDYQELGRQAAALALRTLAGESCHSEIPRFDLRVNEEVGRKLGTPVAPDPGSGGLR